MKQTLMYFSGLCSIIGIHFAEGQQNAIGSTNQPERVDGQCNNDEWHTCIAGHFESLPETQTYHYWLCRGFNGGFLDVCYKAKSNEASRTNIDSAELYRIERPIVRWARASYSERQEVQDLSVDDHPIENITSEIFLLLRITNEIDEIITDLCGWIGCAIGFNNIWYNDVESLIIESAKRSYNSRQLIFSYSLDYFFKVKGVSFLDLPQMVQRLLLLTWDQYHIIRDWNRKNERFLTTSR